MSIGIHESSGRPCKEDNGYPLWWDDTLPVSIPDSPLPDRTDVAIIGGGFAGLSAALELRRSGVEVTLIEKVWPGYGACSRNMGLVVERVEGTTTGDLNGLFHGVKRCDLIREGQHAYDFVIKLIEREGINCGLRNRGKLVLATTKSAYEAMADGLCRLEKQFGTVDAYMLPRQELDKEIGGRANKIYHGAKVHPNHHDLNPGQLTAGMIQRISDLGATICSSTQLDSVQRLANGTFAISTNRGNITAEHVVLATQGYSGEETGFLQKKIFPFLAHVVATKPIPQDLLLELLPTLRGVVDTKQMFFNFRPCDKENRLLLASNYLRTDDIHTQSKRILNSYRKLFPELEKVEAEYCWHGNLALTSDHLPHIGTSAGMHFCATGSFPMALYFGAKIAKRILGADDSSTLFDNIPIKNFPLYSGNPSLLYRGLRMVFHGLDYLNIAAPK
jgi:glycine/D-amino acid oxidase-like deaminating enzyme